MESPELFKEAEALSAEMVRVRNGLQSALMLEGAPFEKGEARDKHIDDWYRLKKDELYEYAFNQLKTENQNLISEWEDLDKREKIIEDIKGRMEAVRSASERAA